MDRRKIEAARGDRFEFFAIVSDAAAGAAQREGRANDERKRSDLSDDAIEIRERMRHAGARHVQTDPQHRFLEQLAVFAFCDRLCICADQFHAVPRERAVAIQLHRGIQRRLSAQSRQNRVRFFAFHDRLDHFGRDRLDISAIGEFRIGHDRGRIGIHQHDLVTFFAQRFARLHAGIIKFAALPDHDWTGADEQDFFELVISRHLRQRGR